MCWTPAVSITTAIIEFVLASALLFFYRRSKFAKHFSALIYLLGIYQFSEFMLCQGADPLLWARIGFITYTFMPALGLHTVLSYLKQRSKLPLLYLPPAVATVIALADPNFITSAACNQFFVSIRHIFHGTFLAGLYGFYYTIYIVIAVALMFRAYRHTKNRTQKRIFALGMIGVVLMVVPTYVLVWLLPTLGMSFPSVLCQFAIFLAIAAFTAVHLDDSVKKQKKSKKRKR